MKIGVKKGETGYGRWGNDSYKKMKQHGFDCADFQMLDTNSWIYTSPEEEVEIKMLHERKLAEEAGVLIWQVHGPWTVPVPEITPEGRIRHMENCKKSIRLTFALGSSNWIIHPVMPYGWNDVGYEEETWKINIEFFSELVQYAKEYGVTICVENMPFKNYPISRPEEILKLSESINDENFKICLDTGHAKSFSDVSVGDAVRLFGKNLRTLHVHDTVPGYDLHMAPYYGMVDWEDFLSALKEIGFEGVFNLEVLPEKAGNDIFEMACKSLADISKEMTKNI